MRIYDLRQKEVINSCDCKRLGFVGDLEINLCDCRITHIIVPGPGKLCGLLGKDMEYVIPCQCIRQVGPDIILVEIKEEDVLVKCKI